MDHKDAPDTDRTEAPTQAQVVRPRTFTVPAPEPVAGSKRSAYADADPFAVVASAQPREVGMWS